MKKRIILLLTLAVSVLLTACQNEEKISPKRKNIEEVVFASGYLVQDDEYLVSSNVDGIIETLTISEGDPVTKNFLIAILKSTVQNDQLQDAQVVYEDASRNANPGSAQLAQIQTQINQAKEQLELDRTNLARYKELREKNSVSQLEFEKVQLQYEASQNNLRALEKSYQEVSEALSLNAKRSAIQVTTQKAVLGDYQIRAISSGQIISVFKKKGELIRRGESIAKIGSGSYKIRLYVSEDDIVKIKSGQKSAVHLNTYPSTPFTATITKIFPGFDENEQSYTVEATFDQLPETLFSGTQLQANIEVGTRKNVLVIPSAYLSKGKYVTLQNGTQKEIVTGSSNANWVEVVSGIGEKDVIVKTND